MRKHKKNTVSKRLKLIRIPYKIILKFSNLARDNFLSIIVLRMYNNYINYVKCIISTRIFLKVVRRKINIY